VGGEWWAAVRMGLGVSGWIGVGVDLGDGFGEWSVASGQWSVVNGE
jgi:hypothetical protein